MPLEIRKRVPEEGDLDEIQKQMGRLVHLGTQFKYVAGVALAFSPQEDQAYVVASVLSTTNWRVIADQRLVLPVLRSREPDYESFREGPLMLEALQRLSIVPDIIFVQGHGIAHPRRFGVASYVGVSFDHPTVGVGDLWPSGCTSVSATVSGARRGNKTAVLHPPSYDHVGWALHSQDQQEPIYVSPGHRVSVTETAELALRCSPWSREPEPLRAATKAVGELRVEYG